MSCTCSHRVDVYYLHLCQPKTQGHARILNTGQVGVWPQLLSLTSYSMHVPTHRVGVYLCQPGTQRHAWIRNTGPARSMATTTKPYKLFHVPTHRVVVYLCQPGTQRHAWIRNTGGVTTTTKYFQTHQWRTVPFLRVTKHFEADSELFHVPAG